MRVTLNRESGIDLSGPGYSWTISLKPGINEVNRFLFDTLRGNAVIQSLIDRGEISLDLSPPRDPVALEKHPMVIIEKVEAAQNPTPTPPEKIATAEALPPAPVAIPGTAHPKRARRR